MTVKRLFFSAMLALIILPSCLCAGTLLPPRSGVIVTQEYSISVFTRIESQSFQIKLHKAQSCRVTATMDSNLLQYADIFVRGGTLHINKKEYTPPKFKLMVTVSWDDCVIDVYAPAITQIKSGGTSDVILTNNFDMLGKIFLSGNGELRVESALAVDNLSIFCIEMGEFHGNLTCDALNITLTEMGKIYGGLKCSALNADLNAMSNAVLRGNCKILKAKLSGMAKLDGESFSAENVVVTADVMAEARLYVVDSLEATAAANAKIHYKGSPKIVKINSQNIKKIE